jgi:phosphatidylinositol alpha-1,6-mannosyltransferase
MKIGVISPEFPPEIGGVETYAYEFVRELANRGHRVSVFTRPHVTGEASLPGVRVVPSLKLRRSMDRAILRDASFDVWHVMNAAYAWVALEASPVIVSVHGNDFLQPYVPVAQPNLHRLPGLWRSSRLRYSLEQVLGQLLTRRLVGRALPRALHILANSRYTEQVLLKHYPACRGITSAAMVGVSPEFLGAEINRTMIGHSRLVTVCRLADPRKNVNLVLRALARLKDNHRFSYTIVGDGPLRPNLENLARERGLEERVRFLGFIDNHELRRLLADSDLFVLTSSVHRGSHEGFGISYLEANACGTPVLAARLAGAVEAVQEGVSGFFLDEPATESIAEALGRFLRQEVKYDPMACRAFASRFSWGKVVDHALAYYPARA